MAAKLPNPNVLRVTTPVAPTAACPRKVPPEPVNFAPTQPSHYAVLPCLLRQFVAMVAVRESVAVLIEFVAMGRIECVGILDVINGGRGMSV